MKRIFALVMVTLACVIAGSAQKSIDADLMKMEKGAWDAFGKGDSKYFEGFLADNAILVSDMGMQTKAESVKGVASKPCTLNKYEFSNFKVTMLDPNTAIATYQATQDGTCGTMTMPAKIYASSVYIKKNGKWWGALHQETPAM